METSPPGIAIIGAGLSGTVLAISLSKLGIQSTIYEARPADYSQGGAITLSANAMRVLDHVGVQSRLIPQGFICGTLPLLTTSGWKLGVHILGDEKRYGFESIRIKRAIVKDELLAELKARSIPVKFDKRLESVVEGGDSVSLRFTDGDIVHARLVIGADGIRSAVRAHFDPIQPHYDGMFNIYGTMKRSEVEDALKSGKWQIPRNCVFLGLEGSIQVQAIDALGEYVEYFANFGLPDRNAKDWQTLANDKKALRSLLVTNYGNANWPEEIQVLCRETPAETFRTWAIHVMPALENWTSLSGRIILIGDAAHALSPTGGQGGGTSLEDAQTLAVAISEFGESDPKPLIQKWEAHRKERLRQVVNYNKLTRLFRLAAPNAFVQNCRNFTLWLFLKMRGAYPYSWIFDYDCTQIEKVLGA